jgi:hypothetical protein
MGLKLGKKANNKNNSDSTDDDNICKTCGGYYDYDNHVANNNGNGSNNYEYDNSNNNQNNYDDSSNNNYDYQDNYNNYYDENGNDFNARYDPSLGHYLHAEPSPPSDDTLLPYPNVKPLTLYERREYDRAGMPFPLDKSRSTVFKNTPAPKSTSASAYRDNNYTNTNYDNLNNSFNNYSSSKAPSKMQQRSGRVSRNTPQSYSVNGTPNVNGQPNSSSTPRSYVG